MPVKRNANDLFLWHTNFTIRTKTRKINEPIAKTLIMQNKQKKFEKSNFKTNQRHFSVVNLIRPITEETIPKAPTVVLLSFPDHK